MFEFVYFNDIFASFLFDQVFSNNSFLEVFVRSGQFRVNNTLVTSLSPAFYWTSAARPQLCSNGIPVRLSCDNINSNNGDLLQSSPLRSWDEKDLVANTVLFSPQICTADCDWQV